MRPRELFVSTAHGLERLTKRELELIPFGTLPQPATSPAGVNYLGHDQAIFRTNLWLRTGSALLVRVGRGKAEFEKELVTNLRKLDWGAYLQPDDTKIKVRATSRKSKLINTSLIHDAVLTSLNRYHNESSENEQEIHIAFNNDHYVVSINSSGDNLHKRHYRQDVATPMPLREFVAAAMHLSTWAADRADARDPPLATIMDPFCGSGTVAIEAALLMSGCAPGLVRIQNHPSRAFPFVDWPSFDQTKFQNIVEEAESLRIETPPTGEPVIFGFDASRPAVEIARKCAAHAGVQAWCQFEQNDILTQGLPEVKAMPNHAKCVSTNPPYGPRFKESIPPLYAKFGSEMKKKYAGWQLALYVPSDKWSRQNVSLISPHAYHKNTTQQLIMGNRKMRILDIHEFEGKSTNNNEKQT